MIRTIAVAATAGIIALSAGIALPNSANAAEELSGVAAAELFVGNTLRGTGSSGRDYMVYYADDNTASLKNTAGFADRGTWRINDDGHMCTTWTKVRRGKEGCFIYKKEADIIHFDQIGSSHSGQVRLIKGRQASF